MAGRPIVPLITASLLLLVVLPLLLLAGLGGISILRGLDEELHATLSSVVNAVAIEAERATKPINRILDSATYFIADGNDLKAIASFLAAEQRSRAEVSSLVLLGKDQRVLAIAPPNPARLGLDYSGQPELKTARERDGVFLSQPFIPPGSTQVSLAAYRRSGNYVVSLLLDLEELSRFLRRLRLSAADHLSIVDTYGRVIASTQLDAVFEQRYIPPEDLAAPDLSLVTHEGLRHFVLAREVLTTGWKAIYYRDAAEARSIVRSFLIELGAVALFSLIGAVTAAILIGRSLSRPFARIIEEIGFIAQGNYGRRIGGEWPEEIDQIAQSFNAMAAKVEQRDQALQESEERIRHDRDEKVILLKEIHHRVKNNLQIISSLLYLQERNLVDPRDVELLRGSEDRIHSMALTHEILYQSADFSAIDIGDYAGRLLSYLRDAYGAPRLDLRLDVERFRLPLEQATPLGLVLNELSTNAFKYALRDSSEPRLEIRIRREPAKDEGPGFVILEVRDNGPGLPEGLLPDRTESLGMSLVTSLVHQLGGTISWFRIDPAQGGLGVRIEFREVEEMESGS